MMKKRIAILIFFFGFSSLLFMSQYSTLVDYRNEENKFLETKYLNPYYNESFFEEFEIKITKPSMTDDAKFSTIILLNGDLPDLPVLLILKKQLVKNNFIVVTIEGLDKYNPEVYFKLNETLNYLLKRNDVKPDQIGIFGHSRGAHYALHFGSMRSDSINSVICGNFGTLTTFYNDYYRFYIKYNDWNHTREIKNKLLSDPFNQSIQEFNDLSLLSHKNPPKNLLLVSNPWDFRSERNFGSHLSNLTDGETYEINRQYGAFFDNNAKKIIISQSFSQKIFGHTSSTLANKVIYEEINWFKQSFNQKLDGLTSESIFIDVMNFIIAILIGIFVCLIIIKYLIKFGGLAFILRFDARIFKNNKKIKLLFSFWVIIELFFTFYFLFSNLQKPLSLFLIIIYSCTFLRANFSVFRELWKKKKKIE
jgi:hypothetical protein